MLKWTKFCVDLVLTRMYGVLYPARILYSPESGGTKKVVWAGLIKMELMPFSPIEPNASSCFARAENMVLFNRIKALTLSYCIEKHNTIMLN